MLDFGFLKVFTEMLWAVHLSFIRGTEYRTKIFLLTLLPTDIVIIISTICGRSWCRFWTDWVAFFKVNCPVCIYPVYLGSDLVQLNNVENKEQVWYELILTILCIILNSVGNTCRNWSTDKVNDLWFLFSLFRIGSEVVPYFCLSRSKSDQKSGLSCIWHC